MISKKRGEREPAKSLAHSQYDPAEFATRHGVSHAVAREIIRVAGQSRDEADTAIVRMRQAASQIEA